MRSITEPSPATAPTVLSRLRIRRLRRLLGPLVFWSITLAVALVSARMISQPLTKPINPFGPSELVAVSTSDLAAGHRIVSEDVVLRELPGAVLPVDAVRTVASLVGKRLTQSSASGRPILARDVTGLATSPLSAKVGSGYRGVMIDLPGVPLKVSPGDRVDLLVARDGDGLAELAVSDAVVIDRLETGVLLRVPETQLATLAGSLVRGRPLLAIRGG